MQNLGIVHRKPAKMKVLILVLVVAVFAQVNSICYLYN